MADKISLNSKYDLDGNYDPSESEDELTPNEKRLLDKARNARNDDSGSEEEVYGFSGSDSDKDADVADSDVEGQEASDDDLPDVRAWGQNKKSFYSTSYVDQDYGGFGKEEEAALSEEKEARMLQKRLAEQLRDEDFSLDFFTTKKSSENVIENENEIVIKSDLSQMSKRQKLQLLEKESPEFSGLVEDFKSKLALANNDLKPVLNMVKKGDLPNCLATQFIKTKYDLILNYCTNISFYLLLKTKKMSIQNHPVIKRLYQYRQLLNQIEPVYEESIKPQIEKILEARENNEVIVQLSESTTQDRQEKKRKSDKKSKQSSKKLKLLDNYKDTNNEDGNLNVENEDDIDDDINAHIENGNKIPDSEDDDDEESIEDGDKTLEIQNDVTINGVEGGEKRAITYQMAKNKGLTPHRKKEQRNPRVKHRNKYRKAKIRRKGAIREVRTEVTRYAGELSGIKSNVKKSIKIR